ncbi:protein of unknown function [Streptomyces sp. KY75]|nr:protein of unknown function [Streptomyces sp. KY75]CAD5988643.1 protein of unknown function [Streptomyces sp. KY70]
MALRKIVRIIPQLADGRIAVEATYATDPTRLAAVIHMFGGGICADPALADRWRSSGWRAG